MYCYKEFSLIWLNSSQPIMCFDIILDCILSGIIKECLNIKLYKYLQKIFKMNQQRSNQPPPAEHRRKTVIAHRGLCSIFPENTKQAILAGIHTSDLTQFDVHLTKDDQIIVFHDRYLSRITDIDKHPEFADRFKMQTIDDYQQRKNDWWVRDFTLAELKQLKVFQPITYRPQFSFMNFEINTLEEIIQSVLEVKSQQIHRNKLKSGLLIQIKEEIAASLTERDKTLCKKIVTLLRKYNLNTNAGCQAQNLPVVIQSFNIPLLTHLEGCQNMLVQLYDKDQIITEEMLLANQHANVKGIGVTQKNLLNSDKQPDRRVGQLCKKLNYSLSYWTIRDDDLNSIPFGCTNYHDVYLKLDELGVTGFITEFPDKCKGILQIESVMYSKGNQETEEKNQKCVQGKQRKLSDCQSMDSCPLEYQNMGN